VLELGNSLDYDLTYSGPALLFRTSNAAVANAYKGTPFPRVSQLGNDFFKSGLIRSETDYIVYEEMNGGFTPGLDVAFFKPRALYHTGLDDIRHASQGSLQHILSTGLTTITNLANNVAKKDFAYGGQPVYFDFLGGNFAQIKMGVLWIWNLLLLLICPWILGSAFYGRITVYGKVILQGFGVASCAFFGGAIVVFSVMAILSRTSAAVCCFENVVDFSWCMLILTLYWHSLFFSLLRPSISLSDLVIFYDLQFGITLTMLRG
jgi:Peptidase family M28